MRFLALLRKELRESLPWLLLAGLLLLAVGIFFLRAHAQVSEADGWQYHRGLSPGQTIDKHRLLQNPNLNLPAIWLAFIAPGLGLVLGVRQFWVPLFTRTWSFLLHRAAARLTILGAKLTATIIAFCISVGLVWTGLYWYACRPDLFPIPEAPQMLVNGWIYIALGLLVYLGTALSALSTARWYTSRIFGLAFAMLVVFVTLAQWRPVSIAALTVLAFVTLLSQTMAVFVRREF